MWLGCNAPASITVRVACTVSVFKQSGIFRLAGFTGLRRVVFMPGNDRRGNLSPQGDTPAQGETPFWHRPHPYSFWIYSFYGGQVFPFVSGFIDRQRYINRLLMLQDLILRASARGVPPVPRDCIPDRMDINDSADSRARFNSVIEIKAASGMPPQQVVSGYHNPGITDMAAVQRTHG